MQMKHGVIAVWTTLRPNMRKRHLAYGIAVTALLLVSSMSLFSLSPYRAHAAAGQYFRASVVSVRSDTNGELGMTQQVQVQLLDGPQKNSLVSIERSARLGDAAANRLPIGSQVLLFRDAANGKQYSLVARWYMPGIATLFLTLLVLVIVIGVWRGITSLFGLTISVCIIASFLVPRIVAGHSAFATCIEAALGITLVSVYVAHGFSKRTTVALVGSFAALLVVVGLTGLASYVTGTSEVIGEDNIGLFQVAHPVDVAGLLTGGVVIASLGALFDITTGQSAAVDEIYKADPTQSTGRLFAKGLSVGREHIAALINTLALVYVGVALPAIVTTIIINQEVHAHVPLLINLNTETIAEEVVRTCVAGIGTLLAMPLTTWLAAYILPRWTPAVDGRLRRWLKEEFSA